MRSNKEALDQADRPVYNTKETAAGPLGPRSAVADGFSGCMMMKRTVKELVIEGP